MTDCICGWDLKNNPHKLDEGSFLYGCNVCIQWLVKNGNAVTNNNWDIPLHIAVRKMHTNLVSQLLHCKSQVNFTNKSDYTPLCIATIHARSGNINDLHVIKMLLDYGAEFNSAAQSLDCRYNDGNIVRPLVKSRKACHQGVIVFMGIRRKLNSVRDTHKMIGKMVWSTRFDRVWYKN